MSRFLDTYSPEEMPGYPCISSPRWSTHIVTVDSGDETANARWADPLHTFTLPSVPRKHEHYAAVRNHWYAMRGPLHTWPFRDPLDFASVELVAPNREPTITPLDQAIGTGDGVTTDFQLIKTYYSGAQTYERQIFLPIHSTVRVALDAVEEADSPSTWTVTRQGGVVSFVTPPGLGVAITAGFFFDCNVRFESDDTFGGILKNWEVAGFADIALVEVPLCVD